MSFQTAPVGLVMTAIVARPGRKRPLPGRIEQPFGREPGLQSLEPECQVAEAGRLDRLDVQLERSLRLKEVDAAVGDHSEPGLSLERGTHPVVTEPHALELVALVLEGEVGMARRGDRDPPDLALDPQVGEARIGPHRAADRPGDVADPQDAKTERARRGRRTRGRPSRIRRP